MKSKIAVVATVPSMVRAFLSNHIKSLSTNYEVTVISNLSSQNDNLDILPDDVILVDLPILRHINVISDIKALHLLIKYFYIKDFSVIYSGTPKGGLLSMIAGWATRVPIRIHTFTGQLWANSKGFNRFLLKMMDRITASLATIVIVDSATQRDFLIENNVVGINKSLVLCDGSISGVDLKKFNTNPSTRQKKRLLMKLDESSIVFLYVGRLKKEKGLLELAKAFSNVYLHNNNVRLWILGPDEENIKVEIYHILSTIRDAVSFFPSTLEPEKYMATADVFCLPSHREGFGSTIIEAAACGIPAIGSRIYGITDAIVDGETGLLVEKENIHELTGAMMKLMNNECLRKHMGKSAKQRVIKYFRQERLTYELMQLINNEITTIV